MFKLLLLRKQYMKPMIFNKVILFCNEYEYQQNIKKNKKGIHNWASQDQWCTKRCT